MAAAAVVALIAPHLEVHPPLPRNRYMLLLASATPRDRKPIHAIRHAKHRSGETMLMTPETIFTIPTYGHDK